MRLAMEGNGLGIRDVVGRSVKVSVAEGRAAWCVFVLVARFLTTMFLFRVSFWLSRMSTPPKSKPASKSSSSSATRFGCGDGALGLPDGEKGGAAAVGDNGGSPAGNDVGGAGADVGCWLS